MTNRYDPYADCCCDCCRLTRCRWQDRNTKEQTDTDTPYNSGFILGGMQAQLDGAGGILIQNKQNIIFNNILRNLSPDIYYDSSTGYFHLPRDRKYYVNWWVSVDGTETTTQIEFAVAIDDVPVSISSSPQVTSQITGMALVHTDAAVAKLSLINVSQNIIRFAEASVQAGIAILGF